MDAQTFAPAVELRDLTVRFPSADRPALGPISLSIDRGERVLLVGPSGCGKSTLLLALTGLIPNHVPAEVGGAISAPPTIAQLFQDADQTLCGMSVEDELAFALENKGVPEADIHARIADILARLQIPDHWRRRSCATLSGGERQLIALASVVIQDADLLIADEPTAQLAPMAAARLQALIARPRPGQSILIVDHRFDGLVEHIDRIVGLDRDGRIRANGPPRTVLRDDYDRFVASGVWVPPASQLDRRLAEAGRQLPVAPLSLSEVLASTADGKGTRAAVASFVDISVSPPRHPASRTPVVELANADCAPFLAKPVLREVSLSLFAGEIAGLVGRNGSGKTTLGATLAGVLPVRAGRRTGEPGGIAFQRPDSQFLAGRVWDELSLGLSKRLSPSVRTAQVSNAIEQWRLGGLEDLHPLSLSAGQKRRLACAALTIGRRWPLIVLDEPTAGLDAAGAKDVHRWVTDLAAEATAILLITHDLDFAATICQRLLVLADGRIAADGNAADLFTDRTIMDAAGLTEPAFVLAQRWLAERPDLARR